MYSSSLVILQPVTQEHMARGVCNQLYLALINDTITSEEFKLLKARIVPFLEENGWYSGLITYPILPETGKGAVHAMRDYIFGKNLWDANTEYGDRRWQLYLHLDQYLYQTRELKERLGDLWTDVEKEEYQRGITIRPPTILKA